jgi:hypothetical protein
MFVAGKNRPPDVAGLVPIQWNLQASRIALGLFKDGGCLNRLSG